jgi:hypothetical protein
MPTKIGSQPGKSAPTSQAKPAGKRGELGAGELDKVVGGMKPIGVVAPKRPTVVGDPCEGGE